MEPTFVKLAMTDENVFLLNPSIDKLEAIALKNAVNNQVSTIQFNPFRL